LASVAGAAGDGINLREALASAGALFDAEARDGVAGFSEPVVPLEALEKRLLSLQEQNSAAKPAQHEEVSVAADASVTTATATITTTPPPPPQRPLHGFYVTMRANGQRRAVLESLLAREPSGAIRVVPHVADEWHLTVAGAAPEPTTTDSHVAVIRRCIAQGLPACLVMEDDAMWDAEAGGVSLHRTFQQALRDLDGRPWCACIHAQMSVVVAIGFACTRT
jgi:hypothetical protein